jgi:hypothetical protein
MNKKLWEQDQIVVAEYSKRCDEREITLMNGTMNFVVYFIMLDNSNDEDEVKKLNAEIKVAQLSTEIAPFLYAYRLGNTQPLINGIQNSNLEYMDQSAKDYLINYLTL